MNDPPLELLDEPIGCLNLSVRTANSLDKAGVLTVSQLLHSCPRRAVDCYENCRCAPPGQTRQPTCYLLDIPNFGEKTLQEVMAALAAAGFVTSSSTPGELQQQTVSSVTGGTAATRKLPRL